MTFPRRLLPLMALLLSAISNAQLTLPSDGSDGAFSPTQDVQIDLALAPTVASWSVPGTGNGVYDPVQWAVVFKFSSVNIPAGVTVTFKNHPKGAPVVWLVQGSVTIAGVVDLNGSLIPGPGGFSGGRTSTNHNEPGQGYGGGAIFTSGSYAVLAPGNSKGVYGGQELIPLIGGSGGGNRDNIPCAGGGAIFIGSRNNILISGTIRAQGAFGANGVHGAGGAIRLVGDALNISGTLNAGGYIPASFGRIRLEGNTISGNGTISPTPSVLNPIFNNTPQIWPDLQAPSIKIVSVGSRAVTDDPAGNFNMPDVSITTGGQTLVQLETQNVPLSWTVTVRYFRRDNSTEATFAQATFNANTGKWEALINLADGGNYLVAKASAPGYPD